MLYNRDSREVKWQAMQWFQRDQDSALNDQHWSLLFEGKNVPLWFTKSSCSEYAIVSSRLNECICLHEWWLKKNANLLTSFLPDIKSLLYGLLFICTSIVISIFGHYCCLLLVTINWWYRRQTPYHTLQLFLFPYWNIHYFILFSHCQPLLVIVLNC